MASVCSLAQTVRAAPVQQQAPRPRASALAGAPLRQAALLGRPVVQAAQQARAQRAGLRVFAVKDGAVLDRPLRVAVIGGGPSGACAAESLAKGGCEAFLIERKMDNCKVRRAAEGKQLPNSANSAGLEAARLLCYEAANSNKCSSRGAAHSTAFPPHCSRRRRRPFSHPHAPLCLQPCGGAIPICMVEEFDLPMEIIDRRVTKMKMISPSNREVDVGKTLNEKEWIGMCRREVRRDSGGLSLRVLLVCREKE